MLSAKRRLILDPTGIPRNGLAGMWIPAMDFDARNLLAWSEAFDNAKWTKQRTAATANQAIAPDGTATADTIATNLETDNHNVYQVAPLTNGKIHTWSLFVKYVDHRWIAIRGDGTANKWASFDLLNGLPGELTPGGSSTMQALGSGWYRISLTWTAASTSGNIIVFLNNADSAGFTTYEGTGTGLYIWGAQLNVGSLQPYNPTTDKQTLFDRSGGNFHGQLGSAAGVDTNDPTWTPSGLSFATNDYVLSPNLPVINLAADWTMYLVAKFDGTANYVTVLRTTASHFAGLLYNGSGNVRCTSYNGAAWGSFSANLVVPTTSYVLVKLVNLRGSLFIHRIDTLTSVSVASLSLTGNPVLAVGANANGTGPADSLKTAFAALYARATSPSEDQRTRRELRRMLSPSGITLP